MGWRKHKLNCREKYQYLSYANDTTFTTENEEELKSLLRKVTEESEKVGLNGLEKEMATHSSVLAWRIQGTGSLVGCRLWGHTESDTTEAT